MISLLLLLALSQSEGLGPTLGRVPVRPLLVDDSSTASHFYWGPGGIKDTKALPWVTVGTVRRGLPRQQMVGSIRPAGPFSDLDYAHLVAQPDALDFANDFTCEVIFSVNSTQRGGTLLSDGQYGDSGEGWNMGVTAHAAGVNFDTYGASSAFTEVDSAPFLPHVPHIVSAGRVGTTLKIKVDGATTVTQSGGLKVVGSSSEALIGRATTAAAHLDGEVYEGRCTSTTWNESAEAAVHSTFLASQRSGADDWYGAPNPILDCRNFSTGAWPCLGATLSAGTQGLAWLSGYYGSGLHGLPDTGAQFDGSSFILYTAAPSLFPAQTGDFSYAVILEATQTALAQQWVLGRVFGGLQWGLQQLSDHWYVIVYSASSFTALDVGVSSTTHPQVLTVSYTDSTGRVDANLDGVATTVTGAHPINPVVPYFILGGDLNTYWPGLIARATVWNSSFTPAQLATMNSVAKAEIGAGTIFVLELGDSIFYGLSGATPPPTQLRTLLGRHYEVTNAGMSSTQSSDWLARWEAGLKGAHNKVIISGPVNDVLNGVSAATAFAHTQQIYDEGTALGQTMYLEAITPCRGYSAWTPDIQVQLLAYNALASAHAGAHYIDVYIALDSGDGHLAVAYDAGDGLHPLTAGQLLIAQTQYSVIFP